MERGGRAGRGAGAGGAGRGAGAGMRAVSTDGVAVYNVSAGRQLPQWASERARRAAVARDPELARRVDLVQDLEFPSACAKLQFSRDGKFLLAAGTHAPQVRCFELSQLSMKFVRHLEAEVVDLQILSEDYAKLALLCNDRSVQLHARPGHHYQVRTPKYGRTLAYSHATCDLLVAGSAPEVYRVNLEQGRFLSPLPSASPAVNASGVSPAGPSQGLLGCAGEDGTLELFDLRSRTSAGALDAAGAAGRGGQALTALRFDATGLRVAAGTSCGHVLLYDLRSSRPLQVKDHMYDSRITSVKFHSGHRGGMSGGAGEGYVVSSCRHVVKVWEGGSGKSFTTLQPEGGSGSINHVCFEDRKGLLLVACDVPKVQAFFVPSLGPAPRWCSFLEGLTEQLEEERTPAVYDDYRFVTKGELKRLTLDHLVGTPALKAYMHGYFLDNRLYKKAKDLADPFAYETYRADRVKEKLEQERRTRISVKKKLPKVNARLASKLMDEATAGDGEEAGEGRGGRKGRKGRAGKEGEAKSLLEDSRFAALFSDKRFAIDEEDEEYKTLHPNAPERRGSGRATSSGAAKDDSGGAPQSSEDLGEEGGSDSDDGGFQSDSEPSGSDSEGAGGLGRILRQRMTAPKSAEKAAAGPKLYHLKEGPDVALEAAAAAAEREEPRVEGNRELNFTPSDGKGGGNKRRKKRR